MKIKFLKIKAPMISLKMKENEAESDALVRLLDVLNEAGAEFVGLAGHEVEEYNDE